MQNSNVKFSIFVYSYDENLDSNFQDFTSTQHYHVKPERSCHPIRNDKYIGEILSRKDSLFCFLR